MQAVRGCGRPSICSDFEFATPGKKALSAALSSTSNSHSKQLPFVTPQQGLQWAEFTCSSTYQIALMCSLAFTHCVVEPLAQYMLLPQPLKKRIKKTKTTRRNISSNTIIGRAGQNPLHPGLALSTFRHSYWLIFLVVESFLQRNSILFLHATSWVLFCVCVLNLETKLFAKQNPFGTHP